MKKLILIALTTTSAATGFAQGTVFLANRVFSGTTHVYTGPSYRTGNGSADSPPGSTDYTGFTLIGTVGGMSASTTLATLLGAPGANAPEATLLPSITLPTTFRTGLAAGNVYPTTDTFMNIPPDSQVATFEMVVWDNSTGLYPTWTLASVAFNNGLIIAGRSAPFVLQYIGGAIFTPPNITSPIPGEGVQSFAIGIPEPTSVALATLGAAALLVFRRPKQPIN
jgi:hypothetical protein